MKIRVLILYNVQMDDEFALLEDEYIETAVDFGPEAPAHEGLPIAHWSHSSLMAYLRNPLAWYKRYVEKVYDTPSGPAAWVGRAGHKALEHFYGGIGKEGAIDLGLEYL